MKPPRLTSATPRKSKLSKRLKATTAKLSRAEAMSRTTVTPKPTDKLTMLPGAGCSLRQALVRMMRAKAGWNVDVPEAHALLAAKLPIERRAGAPLKGGFPVEEWVKKWGDIVVDIGRTSWLPDDWGQGVKWTKPTAHSTGSSGGSLTFFVSPDGCRFYHKERVEEWCGCKLSSKDGFNGQMRRAWLLGLETQCVSGGEWDFFNCYRQLNASTFRV